MVSGLRGCRYLGHNKLRTVPHQLFQARPKRLVIESPCLQIASEFQCF
jgi:hypothetical protein